VGAATGTVAGIEMLPVIGLGFLEILSGIHNIWEGLHHDPCK
jgi:hypothetical protein